MSLQNVPSELVDSCGTNDEKCVTHCICRIDVDLVKDFGVFSDSFQHGSAELIVALANKEHQVLALEVRLDPLVDKLGMFTEDTKNKLGIVFVDGFEEALCFKAVHSVQIIL